ncbi:MAG: hypothetical protein ACYS8K_01900 [Planctomycetota bacterium]|jgi:hypothetical protein
MSEDADKRIEEAVKAEAEGGRIPCRKALALALRLSVGTERVGAACNRAGIKIVECQLGCFQ